MRLQIPTEYYHLLPAARVQETGKLCLFKSLWRDLIVANLLNIILMI